MSVFRPGAFAGILVASIALSAGATASPLGSAARGIGVPADSNVIQVQAKKGKPANAGNVKANTSGNTGQRGNGNRQAGGGGGNHSGRTVGAIAIGAGLVGGLIAAEQQRQAVEQDDYVEVPRCPYGSYINRYGERRCRR